MLREVNKAGDRTEISSRLAPPSSSRLLPCQHEAGDDPGSSVQTPRLTSPIIRRRFNG